MSEELKPSMEVGEFCQMLLGDDWEAQLAKHEPLVLRHMLLQSEEENTALRARIAELEAERVELVDALDKVAEEIAPCDHDDCYEVGAIWWQCRDCGINWERGKDAPVCMSKAYEVASAAITRAEEKCEDCGGVGVVDASELGDIMPRLMPCPSCA